uniref:Uncharacterized protein n=1 Tax=Anopheles culicifacies TaxID=139723 RepID=A0A182MUF8_9DIPT
MSFIEGNVSRSSGAGSAPAELCGAWLGGDKLKVTVAGLGLTGRNSTKKLQNVLQEFCSPATPSASRFHPDGMEVMGSTWQMVRPVRCRHQVVREEKSLSKPTVGTADGPVCRCLHQDSKFGINIDWDFQAV